MTTNLKLINTTTELLAADLDEGAWDLFDAFHFALRFRGYALPGVPFDDGGQLVEYTVEGALIDTGSGKPVLLCAYCGNSATVAEDSGALSEMVCADHAEVRQ